LTFKLVETAYDKFWHH